MVIKSGRFGKFLACPGFPECTNTKPITEDTGAACPVCGAKTRLRLLRRTILQEFPLFCPKCRRESIINARNFQIEEVNQPDARTQC